MNPNERQFSSALSMSPEAVRRWRAKTGSRTKTPILTRPGSSVVLDASRQVPAMYPVPLNPLLDSRMAMDDFAEIAAKHDAVQAVIAREDREGLEIWLLVHSIDHQERLSLYRLRAEMYERYPDIAVRIHVWHSGMSDPEGEADGASLEALGGEIPADAIQIFTR